MHNKEFDSVLALPATDRYAYFIKRLADSEEVWSLWNDGWVLAGDDEGNEVVPIWPHPRFAQACSVAEWSGTEPRRIELSLWLDSGSRAWPAIRGWSQCFRLHQ